MISMSESHLPRPKITVIHYNFFLPCLLHTEISLDSFTVIMILDDVKIKVCLCVEEHYSEIISQLVEAIFLEDL